MKLRQILIEYENDNNLTHDEMIEKLGIARSTYFRWLSGESTQLKISTKKKLSDVLGIDIDALLEYEQNCKPIIGVIKGGYDFYCDENILGYVNLGPEDANKGDYFLRVVGDSMIGSHIHEGDLIYVQQCNMVSNGQIGVVLIGDEATVKKIYFKNNMLILEPSNDKYETKFFTPEEIEELQIQIIGLVRFVRHDFC